MCQKYFIHFGATDVISLGFITHTLVTIIKYRIYIILFFHYIM